MLALVALGHKLPGGRPIVLVAGHVRAAGGVRGRRSLSCVRPAHCARRRGRTSWRRAYAIWTPYQAAHLEEYRDDAVFLCVAESQVRPRMSRPVRAVGLDWPARNLLGALPQPAAAGVLIRDPWQPADRAPDSEHVFILARRMDAPILAMVGTPRVILESLHTRLRKTPATAASSTS